MDCLCGFSLHVRVLVWTRPAQQLPSVTRKKFPLASQVDSHFSESLARFWTGQRKEKAADLAVGATGRIRRH
jgi:hypothetical protein